MRGMSRSHWFPLAVRLLLLAAGLAGAVALSWGQAAAQGGVRVLSYSAESRFPDGILFRVQLENPQQVKRVTARFQVLGEKTSRYDHFRFDPPLPATAEHLVRTDTADRWIPPGAAIRYQFEVEDLEGQVQETASKSFLYMDPRFQWEQIERGPITVSYYGPVRSRAETILEATELGAQRMSKVLGVELKEPIRMVAYNNIRDMLSALPPTARATRRELITQGMTFGPQSVVVLLGSDNDIRGVASHEVTHVLVHRATTSAFVRIPTWLNEGLAEYGNIAPDVTYDQYLASAIARDRLIPLASLYNQPGDPEDNILMYGEGRSVVRFMIERFGVDKMPELMRSFNEGLSLDQAMEKVYGFTLTELENRWRRTIGAAPLPEPSPTPAGLSTPVPWPTVVPFGVPTSVVAEATPTPVPTKAPEESTTGPTTRRGSPGCTRSGAGRAQALDISLLFAGVAFGALVLRRRR